MIFFSYIDDFATLTLKLSFWRVERETGEWSQDPADSSLYTAAAAARDRRWGKGGGASLGGCVIARGVVASLAVLV